MKASFLRLFEEPLHSALEEALKRVDNHRVPHISLDSDSPWVRIEQTPGPELVIWIESGDIYEVGPDGAVPEDPILKRERVACPLCGGDGGDVEDSSKDCDECDGAGRVWRWQSPA